MATGTTNPPAPAPAIHRFTVDQYHEMIRTGILNEYDDVELLDGVIVSKMSKGKDHDTVIEKLNRLLGRVLPPDVSHRCQCVLTLPESEPEPDFVVCTPPEARQGRHPTAADTFLVCEVSDTSLHHDRTEKATLYARVGIPVYWVINLEDWQVEVYTSPVSPPGGAAHYRTRTDYRAGQDVPIPVGGATVGLISVTAIFP